jgi:hypothetical protein
VNLWFLNAYVGTLYKLLMALSEPSLLLICFNDSTVVVESSGTFLNCFKLVRKCQLNEMNTLKSAGRVTLKSYLLFNSHIKYWHYSQKIDLFYKTYKILMQ